MSTLKIHTDGDGCWPDLDPEVTRNGIAVSVFQQADADEGRLG